MPYRIIELLNFFSSHCLNQSLNQHVDLLINFYPHVFCQEFERMNVADALESRQFDEGDTIVKQVFSFSFFPDK